MLLLRITTSIHPVPSHTQPEEQISDPLSLSHSQTLMANNWPLSELDRPKRTSTRYDRIHSTARGLPSPWMASTYPTIDRGRGRTACQCRCERSLYRWRRHCLSYVACSRRRPASSQQDRIIAYQLRKVLRLCGKINVLGDRMGFRRRPGQARVVLIRIVLMVTSTKLKETNPFFNFFTNRGDAKRK